MSVTWKVEKYARYLTTGGRGKWKQYDDSEGDLVLTLTDSSYLVVCRGTTVMESHSLVTARAWMRGMTKKDSMLIMYKIKNETRRFRLKFYKADGKTAEEQCARCADSLSKHFPVKFVTQTTSGTELQTDISHEKDNPECTTVPQEIESLEGEVTLGQMAQVLSGEIKVKLPTAYHHCDMRPEGMDTVIRLCLTDPAFPAFVEQVDQQLQRVIAEVN